MKNKRNYTDYLRRLNALRKEMYGLKPKAVEENKKPSDTYATAFWETMHTGVPKNVMKKGSDGSGGYLVPDTFENRLVKALTEKNVFRQIATTIPTTRKLIIPVSLGGVNATWMTENEPYTFCEAEFGKVEINAHKLGTSIKVSDEMLEDGGIDLEKYIEEVFAERIGSAEEDAFINGDGNGKPVGLVYQAPVGVETIKVGEISADDLVDLELSVSEGYRKNAVWVMSNDAYCRLSQLRHYHGESIWGKGLNDESPMKLMGHPVYISNYMDDVAPGNIPVMFGDFSFYWIGDRGKRVVKRLVERYADRGQVAYITTERVDAKLVLPDAVKLLKVKADEE